MLNGYGKFLKKNRLSQVEVAQFDGVSRQVINHRAHTRFNNIRLCSMQSLANYVKQPLYKVMEECQRLEKEEA